MTTGIATPHSKVTSDRRAWRILTIAALLPAVAYLLILAAAMLGIVDPALWLAESVFDRPWSVLLLWPLVLGGPTLSVIGSLVLKLRPAMGSSPYDTLGVIAWIVLLICLITCVPFPWLFAFAAD